MLHKEPYKKIIALGVLAGFSTIFWYWIKPWVTNPLSLSDINVSLWPLVVFLFLIALEGVVIMLLRPKWLRVFVILVVATPFFIIFGFHQLYIVAFFLMFGLQWSAISNLESETEERIKVNIRQIMRRGLPNMITSLLVLISFAYFLSPTTQATGQNQQLPPSIQIIIEKTIDTFSKDQTSNLSESQKESFLNQASNEVVRQFSIFLEPYFKYLPPILAFGLFLVLHGLSFIFVWFSVLIAMLLFLILKKSGVIRIGIASKEVETLEF